MIKALIKFVASLFGLAVTDSQLSPLGATRNNPKLPRYETGTMIPLPSDFVALEETYDTTVDATTEITLNSATKLIEVSAIGQGIFMKWGTSDATSADWDHYIQAGSTRHFVVPAGIGAINFISQTAGAILAMSELE